MNQTDDELDPQLLARGRRALGVMEMQLTFSNYFVGESLTLADIALVAYTRVADEGGFDLSTSFRTCSAGSRGSKATWASSMRSIKAA